jgi:hypothetical protein
LLRDWWRKWWFKFAPVRARDTLNDDGCVVRNGINIATVNTVWDAFSKGRDRRCCLSLRNLRRFL